MLFFFFFKQKTAYEMRISDWSSDVCSSDLLEERHYLEDPIHAACARTPSGLAWDRVGDVLELTPRQRGILDRARDHDLASGYSLPIRTPGEPEAIFTAARSRDEPLSAEEVLTARLLGSVAYDRARELPGARDGGPAERRVGKGWVGLVV